MNNSAGSYEYRRQTANNRLPLRLRTANMSHKSLRFFLPISLSCSLTRTVLVNLSPGPTSKCRVAINVIKLNLNYRRHGRRDFICVMKHRFVTSYVRASLLYHAKSLFHILFFRCYYYSTARYHFHDNIN